MSRTHREQSRTRFKGYIDQVLAEQFSEELEDLGITPSNRVRVQAKRRSYSVV